MMGFYSVSIKKRRIKNEFFVVVIYYELTYR